MNLADPLGPPVKFDPLGPPVKVDAPIFLITCIHALIVVPKETVNSTLLKEALC